MDAIKFHESVFALPFAYVGMTLAADGFPGWRTFAWITVAMVCARTVGMSANRVIDRHIDAMNPRSADRHLPQGILSAPEMSGLAVVSFGVFLVRGVAVEHSRADVWLRSRRRYLGAVPVLEAFHVGGEPASGLGAGDCSVSGVDWGHGGASRWSRCCCRWPWRCGREASTSSTIHRTTSFTGRAGCTRWRRRFGIVNAFRVARVMDVLAVACLVVLGVWMGLGWPFLAGCAVASGVLAYKYALVSPDDLSKMGVAFGRINAYVSVTLLAGTIWAVYWA